MKVDIQCIAGVIYLNENHWVLIFIDLKKRTFFYLDPFGESDITSTMMVNIWKYVLKLVLFILF